MTFKSVDSSWSVVHRSKPTSNRLPGTSYQEKRGFSLIEIVLSLFLILGLITILLTASTTLIHSRNANLRGTATRISSREIERLREMSFSSLPQAGSATFTDVDLPKLPASTATRNVENYQGDSDIKKITITVNWTEKGVAENFVMETLIAQNGI